MKRFFFVWPGVLVILTCLLVFGVKYSKGNSWMVQNLSPAPPVNPVRLIFIHHSVGEHWLCDDNGGLGIALRDNSYYVSDTYYGWGPDNIGDRTDVGNWWEWFRGPSSSTYVNALYNEGDQHSSYSRLPTSPSGENEVIMFKSCFPNSALQGNPSDPVPTIDSNPLRAEGSGSEYHTVANAKGIYIDILEYFRTRQDKLFIVITAPPLMTSDTNTAQAANARAFNNWLVNEWLAGYSYKNVAVFDFYNVLTSNGDNADTNDLGLEAGNHHRWWNGAIQHIQSVNYDMAAYPTEDSHPSQAGNLKATGEYLDLLNVAYNRWKVASTSSNPCDFNGDGKTDILWRNKTTGQNVVWFMNGAVYSNYAELLQVGDTNWEIVGTGDFNGDGKTDILWRNKTTGQNVVWYMNGAVRSGYSYIDTVADTNWQIVGTGDFNGDGKTDILWRNKTTGQNIVWYMNGAVYSNYAELLQVGDTNWEIVGTGDFNGDGKTDILWRNKTNGQNVVWYMNGAVRSGYSYIDAVADTNWQIVGTGDFNGDGKVDILWRNKSTGQNVVWFMNGAAFSSYAELMQVADTNWEIVGPK